MNILAIDSSGKTAGVCITAGEEILYSRTLDEGLTHSQTLCLLVEEALKAAGLKPGEVDLCAASAGPGSFTGLRIGLSVIKGLCLPYGTRVAAVSTLAAVAESVRPVLGGRECLLATALDARRDEVYFAAFHWNGRTLTRVMDDMAGPAIHMATKLDENSSLPLLLAGDGAEICDSVFNSFAIRRRYDQKLDIARGVAVEAARLAREGATVPAELARPIYLRLSQAERQRNQALQGANGG